MNSHTPSIRLEKAVPQFTVADVVQTAEYYRDVLGFQIMGYFGDPPVFSIVRRDAIELFFNRSNNSQPRTGRAQGAYDAYFHVIGIEHLEIELNKSGATIVEGPVDRGYGQRELVIQDCNGLILAFGEEIETA